MSTHAGHEDTEAAALGVLPEVAGDVEEAGLQGQNEDDPLGRSARVFQPCSAPLPLYLVVLVVDYVLGVSSCRSQPGVRVVSALLPHPSFQTTLVLVNDFGYFEIISYLRCVMTNLSGIENVEWIQQ